MIAQLALTRDTLELWGPRAFVGLVVVMVIILALTHRFAEIGLFLASAALVGWLLFAGGIATIGELSSRFSP